MRKIQNPKSLKSPFPLKGFLKHGNPSVDPQLKREREREERIRIYVYYFIYMYMYISSVKYIYRMKSSPRR